MKTIVENKVGATTVSKFTFRYDELGRRTDRVEQGSTFGTDELSVWGYDELGQVVEQNRYTGNNPDSSGASITAENFEFSYDDIGNRLSSIKGAASIRDYTSNALNQYTSITNPNSSPQYDDDGNMTFDGMEWYFSWDGENRLIFARTYELAAGSGDKQISFAYDYQSRRVEKIVEEFDGTSWTKTAHLRFVYDGWNLLAELEEDSIEWVTAQTYLWGLDLTQSFQGAGGVGGLLTITSYDGVGAEKYYPSYDANGNVMELYGELGSNVAVYRYGPFGELTSISEISGLRNPYRFSTKYFEVECETYYYGYRYYNPVIGRWPSRDPLSEEAFFSDYTRGKSQELVDYLRGESRKPAYVFLNNDGVNKSDFLGLAYFAYRPLGGVLGWLGVQGNNLDDRLNTVVGHEQLFFEDGKSPSNIGSFDDGTLKSESSTSGYQGAHDSGWNDCVMRKAIKNVPLQTYCLLGKPGKTDKFNCQDWAEAVRQEYRKLIKDPKVVSTCCPTDAEKKK